MSGKTGASLGGGTELSPERRRRAAAKRAREDKRWAKKSGPVTTRTVDPATLRRGVSVYDDRAGMDRTGPTASGA